MSFSAGLSEALHETRWWIQRDDGRIECRVCPRRCKLGKGQRGFCGVRRNDAGRMVLDVYGRTTGLAVDPIEKKPLYHFLPASSVLSFGTPGCNLACSFCQNWNLSRSSISSAGLIGALPEAVASAALAEHCSSVAFTYNDPVIWADYAIDTARACHARGVKTVAVTAAYIEPFVRAEFFRAMDATNIDLKAFTDDFYRKHCGARLQTVLDALVYVKKETQTWLEVTTLVIPGLNDSAEELDRATDWFAKQLGDSVPWHFTAFHPDYRMTDRPCTPKQTLEDARRIALSKGLKFVYTGNLRDEAGSATRCPRCGEELIRRDGFRVTKLRLQGGACPRCLNVLPGVFA